MEFLTNRIYKLRDLMNIRQGESSLVFLLLGYSFCIGIGLYIYYTAATTLFLTRFENSMLPIAYIVGGIFVHIIGQINAKAQTKFTFTKLARYLVASLTLSLLLLLTIYQLTNNKWIVFILFLWIRANLFVFSFTFWLSASRIFDFSQAKRLYSLIGVGEVASSIVANYLVKSLISNKVLKVEGLLFLSVIFIGLSYFLLSRIINRNEKKLSFTKKNNQSNEGSIENKKYYLFMYMLGMLPIASLYLIEFSFSVDSKAYFPDKEQLAIFLGQFIFLCSIIELLIKSMLFGIVTKTYGVMSGLILLPVSLIVISLSVFVLDSLDINIFFLVLISRFSITAVRRAFSDTSYQLLYQPLQSSESIKIQNQVETYAKPLGYVVAGGLLLGLMWLDSTTTVHVFMVLTVLLVAWIVLASLMNNEYKSLLLSILTRTKSPAKQNKHSSINTNQYADFSSENSITYDDIKNLIESKNKANRIKGIFYLERSNRFSVSKYLIKLLEDEEESVRLAAITASANGKRCELVPYLLANYHNKLLQADINQALKKIGETGIKHINSFFGKQSDPTLLISLIDTIQEIGGNQAIRFLRSKLTHPIQAVKDRIIEGLYMLQYEPNTTEESNLLNDLDANINSYLWVISAENDLKNADNIDSLLESLRKERKTIMFRIIDLLTLLNTNIELQKIKTLYYDSNNTNKAYLADLISLLINSDEVKNKVLLLFNNLPDVEILYKYNDIYPQQYLQEEKRVLAIINKDILSNWTKALALRQAFGYKSSKIYNALVSNSINPDSLLGETSLYGLHRIEPSRFLEIESYFFTNKATKQIDYCHRIKEENSIYNLQVSRLEALINAGLSLETDFDDLQKAASLLKSITLEEGAFLDMDVVNTADHSGILISCGSVTINKQFAEPKFITTFEYYAFSSDLQSIVANRDSNIYLVPTSLNLQEAPLPS